MKRLHSQKGFTLIELLIVVAVLGILAAIAIPNVVHFIHSGKVAAANTELASAETAAVAYLAENTTNANITNTEIALYMSKAPTGSYTFSPSGNLLTASYPELTWNSSKHQFE